MKTCLLSLALFSMFAATAMAAEVAPPQAGTAAQIVLPPTVVVNTFNIEIINGSATEMSPAVAYTTTSEQSASPIGSTPTPGFIDLCLNGPTSERYSELAANPKVLAAINLAASPNNFGLLEPGKNESFQIAMVGASTTNIHIEMMYGKTKDVCSVINISSDTLRALVNNLKSDAVGSDQVVATGAYLDPALPSPGTSGATACKGQSDARSCLRALSASNPGTQQVRYFPGYLPSVMTALEQAYGAPAAQQIVIPTSGAISYRITLVGTATYLY